MACMGTKRVNLTAACELLRYHDAAVGRDEGQELDHVRVIEILCCVVLSPGDVLELALAHPRRVLRRVPLYGNMLLRLTWVGHLGEEDLECESEGRVWEW